MNELVGKVRTLIPSCEALLVGTGRVEERGAKVEIVPDSVFTQGNLPDDFVAGYPADEDMAGRMFAAFPQLPYRLWVGDYKAPKKVAASGSTGEGAASEVFKYLVKANIAHVLLCGLHSTYGLAWITLYKFAAAGNKPDDPEQEVRRFTADEAELAMYEFPALLYEWQRATQVKQPDKAPARNVPPGLYRLTPWEMRAVIMKFDGCENKQLANEFHVSVKTAANRLAEVRTRLGKSYARLTLRNLLEP